MTDLDAQIEAYMAMLPEIRAAHGSCWAVVAGGKLIGTFRWFPDAALYAQQHHPAIPVLIRHTDEKRGFAPFIGIPMAVPEAMTSEPIPPTAEPPPVAPVALDVILDWYKTLPKRARDALSLANLHDLSKSITAAPLAEEINQ